MLEHLNPSALSVVAPMLLKSLVECEAEVKDKDAKTMITLDAAIQTASRRSALVYLKRAKEGRKKSREFRLKGGGKKNEERYYFRKHKSRRHRWGMRAGLNVQNE